jgi:hypothetical protein
MAAQLKTPLLCKRITVEILVEQKGLEPMRKRRKPQLFGGEMFPGVALLVQFAAHGANSLNLLPAFDGFALQGGTHSPPHLFRYF